MNSAAPVVAMGTVVLTALLGRYLWFFPIAILLRRRKIELSWWLPSREVSGGSLLVGHPLPLHIALRNHSRLKLRISTIQVTSTTGLDTLEMKAHVGPGTQVELTTDVTATSSRYHVLHGATLRFSDSLGLFDLSAYFPNPLPFTVFPAGHTAVRDSSQSTTVLTFTQEHQGLQRTRHKGLAGDLRELRSHQYGDPFKTIAWKATARRQQLMVRELEDEIVSTHEFVLDIGATMRLPTPTRNSRLDHSLALITSLAKLQLDAGNRVGMVTYDSRVYSTTPPGHGRRQLLLLRDALVETQSVVDEDLTDLTASELVATVAAYLAQQEGVYLELPVAPPLEDSRWNSIQTGPKGELYDLAAMERIIDALLHEMEHRNRRLSIAPRWWQREVVVAKTTSRALTRARLFARVRGIELPYRQAYRPRLRAEGLDAALHRAGHRHRPDHTIVVTDLVGFLEDPLLAVRSFGQVRRHGRQLLVLVPVAGRAERETEEQHLVASVFAREETLRLEAARAVLTPRGIPLVTAAPTEDVETILGKIAQAHRHLRRGRAPSAA